MTTKKLVSLVGEQPLSTLLPIRYLKPDEVLFVGSRQLHAVSQHLQVLVGKECPVHLTELRNAYDPPTIRRQLSKKIRKLGWRPEEITCDLSGGNKVMAITVFAIAMDHLRTLVDMEFVRRRHYLRQYRIEDGQATLVEDLALPSLITISDYLNAHAPGFSVDGYGRDKRGRINAGGKFESTIFQALEPNVDEIMAGVRPGGVSKQIEIDLVLRIGNNVGLVEAKTGVNKAGIDQLDTAGNPVYLGKYATKFLVTGRYLPRAHKALATSQHIHVVELPGYTVGQRLPGQEERRLVQSFQSALGRR